MTIPATAQAIYDRLIADQVIAAALGTYTLTGGGSLPAISVLAKGASLPSGTVANGIEISITALPGYAPQLLLSDETLTNPTWRIYLLAWGQLGAMQQVTERVIALLPGATSSMPRADPPGEGLGVIEQTVITWTNPCAVVNA